MKEETPTEKAERLEIEKENEIIGREQLQTPTNE